MRSLRQRAIVGGILWALVSFGVGSLALLMIFQREASNRFDDRLLSRNLTAVAALAQSYSDPGRIVQLLADPDYAIPLSGSYWQATGPEGAVFASPSLVDTVLEVPDERAEGDVFWMGEGPTGRVRGATRSVTLPNDDLWTITTAEALTNLEAETSGMRRALIATLLMLALLVVIGAVTLTSAVLAPLGRLRADVMKRWQTSGTLDASDYPLEVAPLVEDINRLIISNRDRVERSRRQTADLAHALKTPSAILRNELTETSGRMPDLVAARSALERIDAQIARSLGRIRAVNASTGDGIETTEVSETAGRLSRLFGKLPTTQDKTFTLDLAPGLHVAMDGHDLDEVLGTLLENAFQWCRSEVMLATRSQGAFVEIRIEDDGPGIPEDKYEAVLEPGQRLDTSKPGTGIGLSMVTEMAGEAGGALVLGRSDTLGGLSIRLRLPAVQPRG